MVGRNLTLVVAILLLVVTILSAQEEEKKEQFGWLNDLVGSLNLTQNRYSSNWTQGGENSFAWKGQLDTKFEDNQPKTNWRNTLKFTYGQVKQGEDDIRKSDDELKFESVFKLKSGRHLNPYMAVNFETQVTRGYLYTTKDGVDVKEPVADFLSPAFLRESLGLGYKPSEVFMTRLGFSVKHTIVKDESFHYNDQDFAIRPRYGNRPDQAVRTETGIESTTDVVKKLEKNVIFTSKLELFSSFENFSAVDVNWDNTLTAKFLKYFALNFNVRLFYDEDILKELQVKQSFGFGVTYAFF